MKKLSSKIDWRLWLFSLLVGIVATALLAKLPFIRRTVLVGLFLTVLYNLFAIWCGLHLKSQRWGWALLVFPVAYLIGAYFFAPRYTWYFALVYLGISYLAWSLARTGLTKQQ